MDEKSARTFVYNFKHGIGKTGIRDWVMAVGFLQGLASRDALIRELVVEMERMVKNPTQPNRVRLQTVLTKAKEYWNGKMNKCIRCGKPTDHEDLCESCWKDCDGRWWDK